MLSDLAVALGQLYLSIGVDILPAEIISKPLPEAITIVKEHFNQNTFNFMNYIDQHYETLFKDTFEYRAQGPLYTLQLFGSYKLDNIKNIKNSLATKTPLKTAKTKRGTEDWYILTLGQFNSMEKAKAELKILPEGLNELQPWVRKVENVTWLA